jgi:dTDP-4-dehydrorhamnose reductase
VSDQAKLFETLEHIAPDVIIHAAAEGGVDTVEGKVSQYRELNVGASRGIAAFTRARGIQYVFVSSNAVFGDEGRIYRDDSPHSPVNDYGRLKSEAEDAVMSANSEALIVRPILMYGWPYPGRRLNPVVGWINSLRARRPISVVNDVWTEPLAAWDCADAIWSGISAHATGAINISGGVRMTLYELAIMTGEVFNLDTGQIRPISSASLPGLAPRPMDTAFDLVRLTNELLVSPMGPSEGLAVLRDTEIGHGGSGR